MRKALLIILAVLAVSACGDDDASTTTTAVPATTLPPSTSTTTPATTTTAVDSFVDVAIDVIGSSVEVRVEGAANSGRIQVDTGAEVRITVTADITDEVHLHGYDLNAEVAPGQPAVIEFTAEIPGIFEVELESSHRSLVELQVS